MTWCLFHLQKYQLRGYTSLASNVACIIKEESRAVLWFTVKKPIRPLSSDSLLNKLNTGKYCNWSRIITLCLALDWKYRWQCCVSIWCLQIEWQKIGSTLNLMAFNFYLLLLFFHLFFVLVDWISKRNGKWLDYKVQNGFNFFNMEIVKLNVWHICGETVCLSLYSSLMYLGDALQRHRLQALSLPLVND